jgi:hypothetical protein
LITYEAPLSPAAKDDLRHLTVRLLSYAPDYTGPLSVHLEHTSYMLSGGPNVLQEHNGPEAIRSGLAELTEEITSNHLTVKQADPTLAQRYPITAALLVLCPIDFRTPVDQFGIVYEFLDGMRLFRYDQPEIMVPASAEIVRQRRNDHESKRRIRRLCSDGEKAAEGWTTLSQASGSGPETLQLYIEELSAQIAAALPQADAMTRQDVLQIRNRTIGQEDYPNLELERRLALGNVMAAAIALQLLPAPPVIRYDAFTQATKPGTKQPPR